MKPTHDDLKSKEGSKGKRSSSLASDIVSLKKLWPDLRANRRLLLAAVILIPMISVLQAGLPLILRYGIDEGILKKDYESLGLAALIFLGAVILEYFSRAGQSISTSLAVHRMIKSLRARLIRHVMTLAPSYHDRNMSGALVTRATSEFDNLSESLNMGVLTSVVDFAVLAGCIAGMIALSFELSVSALVILPFVGWIVAWFSRELKRAMLDARSHLSVLNAYTQECLYGASTIKLLGAEDSATERYGKLNRSFRDSQMRSVVLDSWMFSVLDGVASVTVGIVVWVAITRLTDAPALSAGVMVAFIQYVQQLFEPIKQLGNKMAMLQGAFTSIERIFGVLEINESISGGQAPAELRGTVAFEQVSFAYRTADKGETRVLDDVSFTLAAGQSLALVGATGGGKSTIVKLLAKLYDGYAGRILIDDQDLRELSGDLLRKQMAIVPQDIVLFDGSISFNISLGQEGISQADVQRAAEIVQAHLFIERLPGGYDFLIREQGGNLSHGQRQLIAFARALARNPRLVILDEATSSVDSESEAAIQAAIDNILEGRTVIVIAHRLATVRKCDKILVIDRGRIVESGAHDDLLAKKSAYFLLHQALA